MVAKYWKRFLKFLELYWRRLLRALYSTRVCRFLCGPDQWIVAWFALFLHVWVPIETMRHMPSLSWKLVLWDRPISPWHLAFSLTWITPVAIHCLIRWVVDPGCVKADFKEKEQTPSVMRPQCSMNGSNTSAVKDGRRVCDDCAVPQPLRSKHCKICKRCIRTHDHHCAWLAVCIGENNMQLFFLYNAALVVGLTYHLVLPALEQGPKYWAPDGLNGDCLWRLTISPDLLTKTLVVQKLAVFCMLVFNFRLLEYIYQQGQQNLTTSEKACWSKIPHISAVNKQGKPWDSPYLLPETAWQNACAILCCPRSVPGVLRKLITGLEFDANGWIMWEGTLSQEALDPSRRQKPQVEEKSCACHQ